MTVTCDYCKSIGEEGAGSCRNCGAPFNSTAPDFRFCPHCCRRLLALGSPACSYCGQHLPADYLKAREASLRRISDTGAARIEMTESQEADDGNDNAVRRLLGNLFGFDKTLRRK